LRKSTVRHINRTVYMPDSLFPQSLSTFSLVYLLSWHSQLHTPYISSPLSSFRSTCQYHHNLFYCGTEILSFNPSLSLNPLLGTLSCSSYATHPSNHSHLCPLKCHFIFLSHRPGLTSTQHTTSHTTAVQSLSHYPYS